MTDLPAGRFYGRMADRWQLDGLMLSESVYEPRTSLAPHAHARPYLCLVLKGGYRETIGARSRECAPGTVVVHPPSERHANRFSPTGGHLFRLEVDESWMAKCGGFDAPAEFHGGPLSLLANRMFRELRARDDLSPMMIEALALEFAVGAVRGRARDSSAWLSRVQDYLHEHYAESIRLDDLSRVGRVHAAHLNRAFRARFGCSIGEYTRRLRVEHAARLLESSTCSLAEIASAAGFADQSHFSRVFVRMMGTTPGKFRR